MLVVLSVDLVSQSGRDWNPQILSHFWQKGKKAKAVKLLLHHLLGNGLSWLPSQCSVTIILTEESFSPIAAGLFKANAEDTILYQADSEDKNESHSYSSHVLISDHVRIPFLLNIELCQTNDISLSRHGFIWRNTAYPVFLAYYMNMHKK